MVWEAVTTPIVVVLTIGLSKFRAKHLSYHDWRHAALTHMAARTNKLVGMAFLAGHKDVTTMSRPADISRRRPS